MSAKLVDLRVLVVDDNFHMRKIVAEVVRAIGVKQVEECSDGAQALDCLRQWRADVAIVDFNMSPIDGVEFTRLVRLSPDSVDPFLPIIMLTAHSERARVEEARDAGVTEFILKPVTAQSIIGRLNAIINNPRPFVRTDAYFGPDRRRRTSPDYDGPRRRREDGPQDEAANG
jgi:CheY-like chemotaxis protein